MIPSLFALPSDAQPRVLMLGAHCDDVEIGCAGTLQVLATRFPAMSIRWIVLSSPAQRASETKNAAAQILPTGTDLQLEFRAFKESYFPYIGAEIKDCIEAIAKDFRPDVVFTHHTQDRHQDHRLVAELTHNAFRDHVILEYEVVKYDGDLGSPNVFVPVSREQLETKVRGLMSAYESQRTKFWFTEDTFTSLMRLRGVESRSPTGFAEAFHCRKLRFFG